MRVDNIVCLAFGSTTYILGDGNRAATQHTFACAVSNYLSQRYATKSSTDATPCSVPIVAQDPSYFSEDALVLSYFKPSMSVVAEPYQYLTIPSTLVISLYPLTDLPIYKIVADITFPMGTVAMVCADILSHPWHKEGKIHWLYR